MEPTFDGLVNIVIFVFGFVLIPVIISLFRLSGQVKNNTNELKVVGKRFEGKNTEIKELVEKIDHLIVQVTKLQTRIDMIYDFPQRMSEK